MEDGLNGRWKTWSDSELKWNGIRVWCEDEMSWNDESLKIRVESFLEGRGDEENPDAPQPKSTKVYHSQP